MKRCWMLIVCGALLWGGFVPETAALEVPGETIGEKSAETEKKAVPEKEEQPSEIDRILSDSRSCLKRKPIPRPIRCAGNWRGR